MQLSLENLLWGAEGAPYGGFFSMGLEWNALMIIGLIVSLAAINYVINLIKRHLRAPVSVGGVRSWSSDSGELASDWEQRTRDDNVADDYFSHEKFDSEEAAHNYWVSKGGSEEGYSMYTNNR